MLRITKDIALLLMDEQEESKRCMQALAQAGIEYRILPCSDLYAPVLMTRTQLYRGLERIQEYAIQTH